MLSGKVHQRAKAASNAQSWVSIYHPVCTGPRRNVLRRVEVQTDGEALDRHRYSPLIFAPTRRSTEPIKLGDFDFLGAFDRFLARRRSKRFAAGQADTPVHPVLNVCKYMQCSCREVQPPEKSLPCCSADGNRGNRAPCAMARETSSIETRSVP